MKTDSILIIVAISILIISVLGTVFTHELNHVFINEKAGIKSHIDYLTYFPNIATIKDTNPTKDLTNLDLAHSINESVGYNTMNYFVGIIVVMIIGFIYLGHKIENKNN